MGYTSSHPNLLTILVRDVFGIINQNHFFWKTEYIGFFFFWMCLTFWAHQLDIIFQPPECRYVKSTLRLLQQDDLELLQHICINYMSKLVNSITFLFDNIM